MGKFLPLIGVEYFFPLTILIIFFLLSFKLFLIRVGTGEE